MRGFLSPAPVQQRGSFAMLAVLLLLIVVALALRYLLLTTQASTYAVTVAHDSMRAVALADSGLELTLARLQAGPNKNNTDDCVVSWLGSGQQAVSPVGSYELSAISLAERSVPESCYPITESNPDGKADVCRMTVTGRAGDATRTLVMDVGSCTNPPKDSGLSGAGGAAANPIRYTITPRSISSVALLNIAYRRGAPSAAAGLCSNLQTGGACISAWDVETSSGLPSIGSIAQVAVSTTLAEFGVSQLLNTSPTVTVNRTYAAVGGIFEGSQVSYVGKCQGPTTMTNSGETIKSVPDGRASWCKDADTLVFNISAGAVAATDGLNGVSFGSGANAVDMTLLQRYRNASETILPYGVYSEIWYVYRPLAAGGIASLFTLGADTPFTVLPNHSTSSWQWAGGFLCLKGVEPNSIRGIGRGWEPLYWWEPL